MGFPTSRSAGCEGRKFRGSQSHCSQRCTRRPGPARPRKCCSRTRVFPPLGFAAPTVSGTAMSSDLQIDFMAWRRDRVEQDHALELELLEALRRSCQIVDQTPLDRFRARYEEQVRIFALFADALEGLACHREIGAGHALLATASRTSGQLPDCSRAVVEDHADGAALRGALCFGLRQELELRRE